MPAQTNTVPAYGTFLRRQPIRNVRSESNGIAAGSILLRSSGAAVEKSHL